MKKYLMPLFIFGLASHVFAVPLVIDNEPIKLCPQDDPLTGQPQMVPCPRPYVEKVVNPETGEEEEPQPLPGPIPEEQLLPVTTKDNYMRPGNMYCMNPELNQEQIQSNALGSSCYQLHNKYFEHTDDATQQPSYKSYFDRQLFIIGNDQLSISWLKKWRERLIEIGAVGIAVEVPDLQTLQHLRRIGDGLKITAGNGESIVDSFDSSKGELKPRIYPVLINKYFFEQ